MEIVVTTRFDNLCIGCILLDIVVEIVAAQILHVLDATLAGFRICLEVHLVWVGHFCDLRVRCLRELAGL